MQPAPRLIYLDWLAFGHSLARRAAFYPAGSTGRAWCKANARDALRAARDVRRANRQAIDMGARS